MIGPIVRVAMREEPDGSEVCSILVSGAKVVELDSGNGEVEMTVNVPRSG